jgi:predicted ribosome quality control (RQC) complex YloA/Tae2 family protein
MQPFDALTMRAVLLEARPLLLNRRIDKIYQLSRDEILLVLRLKTGPGNFLVSAQASFGRLCLTAQPALPKHVNPPAFCQLLRKHLTGAIIIDARQVAGERVADLTLACTDELGTKSTKILTAEVMGRHSNLIFWDKDNEKILGASHVVTAEMSRQREVAPGLSYVRPPRQDKQNIFLIERTDFDQTWAQLAAGEQSATTANQVPIASWEQWLLATYSGIGRHCAEELLAAANLNQPFNRDSATAAGAEALWKLIQELQSSNHYRPAMRLDLTRYSVLSWWPELHQGDSNAEWKKFPSTNDMIDEYFRTLQEREQLQQLRDRIRTELRTEQEKFQARLLAAQNQLQGAEDLSQFKAWGDLILSHIAQIQPGQAELHCDDLYSGEASQTPLVITLNPNLSASQNAQHYYRQFAKARVRKQAAGIALNDAQVRIAAVANHVQELEAAKSAEELNRLKEMILDRGKRLESRQQPAGKSQPQKPQQTSGHKAPRLMSTKSSDGWLIYIGRNRNENDVLISKIASPADIWLHVQGQEGAHVLIKSPNKQDPPGSTLKEAAQLAARFSRISLGSKVRVVYTHVKYVKKIGGKDKPGLVRYENERTLEVDTSAPMPPALRKLFNK